MRGSIKMKKRAVGKKAGITIIQHDGWSTTANDPGNTCPKCGGAMCYSGGGDDAIFCVNGIEMGMCDFQYSFTDAELERNLQQMLAEWDEEARQDTQKYIKEHGRPVFGEVNPERFILPSVRYKSDFR